jgi:hypothetical protein
LIKRDALDISTTGRTEENLEQNKSFVFGNIRLSLLTCAEDKAVYTVQHIAKFHHKKLALPNPALLKPGPLAH